MSRSLEYRIAEPNDGVVHNSHRLIVIPPGFRDSIHLYLSRKAQATANITGHRVLYYDSPATGSHIVTAAERKSIIADPVANAAATGQHIARILGTEGASHAVMAGNSRGATEAITVAATETVPLAAVALMDTVGLVDVSLPDGIWRYASYQVRDRLHVAIQRRCGLLPPDEPIHITDTPPMVDQLTEMRTHIGLACSDIPLRAMIKLGVEMPNIPMNLVAAEHTFTAPANYMHLLAVSLPLLRSKDDAPLSFTIDPGTWHSSFEEQPRFAGHTTTAITMANAYGPTKP